MVRKYKLLDLFCGAGGCSMGYYQAGFEVTGVDINPQKNYPFKFIQCDVFDTGLIFEKYDVIHASPPCQNYSVASKYMRNKGKKYSDLLSKTRDLLIRSGKIYVMENVPGAPMRNYVKLCGTSFNLGTSEFSLIRHRLFECNIMLFTPPCQHTNKLAITVCGTGTMSGMRDKIKRNLKKSEVCEAMGIDWMTLKELSQAIPPAYTEYLGEQLIQVLK